MNYQCSIYKEPISQGVNQYSINRFGKALCRKHQETETPTNGFYCAACNETITHGEFKYSLRHFDKPLCRNCQPEMEEKVSAAPRKFQGTYKIEVSDSAPKKKTLT